MATLQGGDKKMRRERVEVREAKGEAKGEVREAKGAKKRVLLAFSGGIDSCASAEALRAEGYDVELLTIDMLGDEAFVANAQRHAERLSLPLHIIDEVRLFEQEIVEYFTSEYIKGRTPAPCTRCNSLIKWRLLAREADRLGIYHIATGHYFNREEYLGHIYVARGLDPRKDQSYSLWGVEEQTLRRVITPMGGVIKAEVKRESPIKVESMGICFLRGQHYTDFIAARCGGFEAGEVVEKESGEVDSYKVVGRHNGIARYTIGQRRGEGIPSGLRVTGICGAKNRLFVGENRLLYQTRFDIVDCHFIDPEEVFSSTKVEVMVRGIGRNPEGYAHLTARPNGGATIHLDGGAQAWALAAGQPVALYIGNRVVGGGYIEI